MNFEEAIAAHILWKVRLGLFMEGLERLDANTACKDNACVLGQWLYSDGQKYQHVPSYELLRRNHAQFHETAADVIRQVEGGRKNAEEALIGSGTPFYQLSRSTVKHLIDLRDAIQHGSARN